jgi:hypothetical protein
MTRVGRMRAIVRDLEILVERAREHERRMADGIGEAAGWARRADREWITLAASDARVARAAAEARLAQGRALLLRTRDRGGQSQASSSEAGGRFAVMEDESVLCAECVHEVGRSGEPESAATSVHAWIAAGAGVCCAWCGESPQLDDADREG